MSTSPSAVRDPNELSEYAVKSYRYLRIAIVMVLVALCCAVILERAHAGCFEGSISAYYYTPAHSLFVGALVALGVCLIAIRGNGRIQNVLMNVAGVLAPIVAFVPTAKASTMCTAVPYAPSETLPFINNNLVALGIALGLAVVLAAAIILTKRQKWLRDGSGPLDRHSIVGVGLSAVLLVAGAAWYATARSNFLDHAHGGGAALLFAIIGVVILINGLTTPRRSYGCTYVGIAAAMAVTAAVVAVIGRTWELQILWLETIELLLLLAYWALQTAELWSPGVLTEADLAAGRAQARSDVVVDDDDTGPALGGVAIEPTGG